MRKIYENDIELHNNWRQHLDMPNCEHEEETVTLQTNYGRGRQWQSKACRKCGFITGNVSTY